MRTTADNRSDERDGGGTQASPAPGQDVTMSPRAVRFSVDEDNRHVVPGSLDEAMERPSPAATQESPLSPPSGGRGFSLRRSIFNRGGDDAAAASAGPEIEMQSTARRGEEMGSRASEKGVGTDSDSLPAYSAKGGQHQKKETPAGFKGSSALPNYNSWATGREKQNALLSGFKASYHRVRKFVLRIRDIPPSKDGRHIDLDAARPRKERLTDERTSRAYVGNTIRSTRYSAYSFLPRQLFAQFSKLANFYFLVISILQLIPGLSTTGQFTTIVPLLIFVSISIAKEGYDDLRRYRLDKAENNKTTLVMHADKAAAAAAAASQSAAAPSDGDSAASPTKSSSSGGVVWVETKWLDVRVGDVVKLHRDDAAPADLVVLHSTNPQGIAYVETMALDGETNLKSKQATASLKAICDGEEAVARASAHFVVEDPNLDLYNFEGRVTVDGKTSPLTTGEVIYRGSVLRNTAAATGMVVFTGEECKIRMNANKNPRIKAPALQTIVNRIVIVIVIFVLSLSIYNTVAYQLWDEFEDRAWYLTNAGVAFFPILASFIIMFNTMIPLSLYVSLEIVKLCQMFFFNDLDMYDPVSGTPCEARTSTINEELGQISYVFSDKTGTLTDNSMKFRKISVGGTSWLHAVDLEREEAEKAALATSRLGAKGGKASVSAGADEEVPPFSPASPTSPTSPFTPRGLRRSSTWRSSARPGKTQRELQTTDLVRYLERHPDTPFAQKATMFLLAVALCHTCLPERRADGTTDFQASSPDELALVRGAQELGFLVADRDLGTLTLRLRPHGPDGAEVVRRYEVLDVIEFSSKRKRMSALVRFPDGRACLLMKGADSAVVERLRLARLAGDTVVEIERRANLRRSVEAQHAIRRKSEQVERRRSSIGGGGGGGGGGGRPSFGGSRKSTSSLNRPSLSGISRASGRGAGMQPIRDELDSWLRNRERDVDGVGVGPGDGGESEGGGESFFTPRQSTQLPPQQSNAAGETDAAVDEVAEEAGAADERSELERTFTHINEFATEGLRTLMYGHRFLDEDEYREWKKVYQEATTSLTDRTALIEEAGELIERRLELTGATAIEDKLQAGVPEAIDKLRRANIRMWMLTGDKRETAINIGHSCRLIKDYSHVTVLDHEAGEVERDMAAAITACNSASVAHSVVVVDGQTLALVAADAALQALFLDLAVLADAVVCCRASPAQKAALVKAVRKRVKGSITLAIGDGANDIAMIQEAHVGIGITGKEGLQAARSSDYSVAQFRFLVKLLLVHGRWNYVRTCKYTVATFWKEMLFYLTQALYQRWTGYTGTSLYEPWSLSMFNTLFTSLPVIVLGIFTQDLSAETLLAVPELYSIGQRNAGFNLRVYLGWMFMAAAEAVIVFFAMMGLFSGGLSERSAEPARTQFPSFAALSPGRGTGDNYVFAMGALTYSAVVAAISVKLQLLETHNRSYPQLASLVLSVGGWFLWNILLSATYHSDVKIYAVRAAFLTRFGRDPTWWAVLALALAAVVALEVAATCALALARGDDTQAFQALEQDPVCRARFARASALEMANSRAVPEDRHWFAPLLEEHANPLYRLFTMGKKVDKGKEGKEGKKVPRGEKVPTGAEAEVKARDAVQSSAATPAVPAAATR